MNRIFFAHLTTCLGLLVLALLAYSNSFDAGFVFDNRPVILDNSRLREPFGVAVRQIARMEYWWPGAGQGLYRPLTTFSYWCNYRLLGNADQPAGYHIINFALHVGNAMLVYALVLALANRPGAFVAGAIFALHPIATEAVTNIVGRADLLATLGVVGGLLAHIQTQTARGWRRGAWLGALMIAFGIGLFSKENAIVLPAVMLLHDLAFRRRRWANYGALLPVLVVWFVARQNVFAHNPALPLTAADYIDNALLKGDAWTARLTAVKIIGKYLWLLLWPQTLSADYSYNQVALADWRDATLPVAIGVIVAALVVALRLRRRQPVVSYFMLFFFVALAPVSNLFFLCSSTMAERFLYLPSVAFAGLAGWLVAGFYDRAPRRTAVLAGVLLLAYGVRTYARNEDWHDDIGFWVKLVNTSPRSFRGHAGLAAAVIKHDPEHRYTDAAVASVQRALAIVPDALPVQINAGQVYRIKGDAMTNRDANGDMEQTPASAHWYQQSLAALQRAAALLNGQQTTSHPLGIRLPNAAINVNESTIHDELGQTWLRLGNSVAAVESFRQARRANPTRETIYLHLGDALAAAGQPAEAARSYWQALFIATDRAPAQKALVPLYVRDCPQLNASCPRIHDDICAAYAEMAQLLAEAGQNDDAQQAREHAVTDYHCPP